MKLVLALLVFAAPLAGAQRADLGAQRALLKDWVLSRCIGRGLGPGKTREDAYASAAALLERGAFDIDAYNRLDVTIDAQLAGRYGGSIPGDFVMLKCLDLYHGPALDRQVRSFRATPVR